MKKIREIIGVVENLGWHDRTIRILLGAALISIPCYFLISGRMIISAVCGVPGPENIMSVIA